MILQISLPPVGAKGHENSPLAAADMVYECLEWMKEGQRGNRCFDPPFSPSIFLFPLQKPALSLR
jgi:hypothetical protein